MTLVSSGTLYLVGASTPDNQSIQYECEGLKIGGFTLLEAQAIASGYVGSLPTGMLDFYGFNNDPGSTIVYDFNATITWTTNNSSSRDGYRALDFTGRQSGDIITLNVNSNFTETTDAVIWVLYYSINSTSSWNNIVSRSATSNDNVNIPGVDYNDVVRLRADLGTIKSGAGYVTITLTGGTFTSGSGTITASGTTTWYLWVDDVI